MLNKKISPCLSMAAMTKFTVPTLLGSAVMLLFKIPKIIDTANNLRKDIPKIQRIIEDINQQNQPKQSSQVTEEVKNDMG